MCASRGGVPEGGPRPQIVLELYVNSRCCRMVPLGLSLLTPVQPSASFMPLAEVLGWAGRPQGRLAKAEPPLAEYLPADPRRSTSLRGRAEAVAALPALPLTGCI